LLIWILSQLRLREPSYIAVIQRRLLQPFLLGLSLFLFVLRSLDKFPSRLCKTVGLRSSDREGSEGVSVMAPSAAVTKFLTDWACAASDEAHIALEDESYNSPDFSVVVKVL
jgi:hypothetical protein